MLRSAVILLALMSTSAPATIFEVDDRVAVAPVGELAAIGIVTGGDHMDYGTGFLIGACTVLTARHAAGVVSPVGRFMEFRAKGKRSRGVVIAAGKYHPADQLPRALKEDWLLLRLDKCLGRSVGYLTLSALGPSAMVEAAGYPGDRPITALTIDRQCTVRSIGRGELNHDCATLPGNSGGPILQRDPAGRLVAVGINVAGDNRAVPEPFQARNANVAVETATLLPLICPLLGRDENEGCKRRRSVELAAR